MTATGLDVDAFERVVFFTGAGLSAECGLPTYRGRGGVWDSYDYEQYACQAAFERDPGRVWEFHDERRRVMGAAEPGRAHRIIARLQQRRPATRIVTQNIDGLHQRAGAKDVVELHGSIWRLRCHCAQGLREDHQVPLDAHRCGTCGAWLRPDIVWFGDSLRSECIARAVEALSACDLLVSIGTSASVYPAADLPHLARRAGAVCVEVNPEETPLSPLYGHHLRCGASEALARLWPRLA